MEQELNNFKIWLQSNSKKSKTVHEYTNNIRVLFDKANINSILDLTEDKINNYFSSLQGIKSQATINAYRSAIKSFIEFKGISIRLPKTKKPPKRLIKIIPEDVFKNTVLPVIETEFKDPLKVKTILSFLYHTGLRIKDVPLIKRNQFDLAHNNVKVFIQKQNMEKEILISNELKEILIKYFESEAEVENAFNITFNNLRHIFKKLNEFLPELHIHPHKFRKSFATNSYRLGMKINEIKEMMGHKSILTTEMYIQPPTDREIREKFLKLESQKIRCERRKNND